MQEGGVVYIVFFGIVVEEEVVDVGKIGIMFFVVNGIFLFEVVGMLVCQFYVLWCVWMVGEEVEVLVVIIYSCEVVVIFYGGQEVCGGVRVIICFVQYVYIDFVGLEFLVM